MKIAICDDCLADRERLKRLILENAGHPEEVCFDEFSEGRTLLERYQRYDIVFLDIMIEGETEGVKTASNIRLKDENALLVFYTAYDYPASRIIGVRPFQYLVKVRETEKLQVDLLKVIREAERRKQVPYILAVYKSKQYVLKPEDILYISILDKGTAIYLTKEKASELCSFEKEEKKQGEFFLRNSGKLNDHYMMLKAYGFVYAKKSYIINIHHIAAVIKNGVQLEDGTILNVARSKRKEFESQCSRYWRNTGENKDGSLDL